MLAPVYLALIGLRVLTFAACRASGFEAVPLTLPEAGAVALVLAARSGVFAAAHERAGGPRLGGLIEGAAVLFLSVGPAVTVTYAVQGFARPLRDDALTAFDRAIGFYYPAFMAAVTADARVVSVLTAVYHALPALALAVFALGHVCRRERRIAERFATAFLTAVSLAAILGGLFPARGAVMLLDPATRTLSTGATPIDLMDGLRAGTIRAFPPGQIAGIISFPSMHVGIGALCLHAVREIRWARILLAPACLGMMFTALTNGGHYAADCLAGLAVAGLAIALTNALYARAAPRPRLVPQAV